MNIKWTLEDKQFIKDHASNVKDKDLATALANVINVLYPSTP